MRHPVCTALYRTLLPADAGYRLARWVSRRLHTDSPDPKVVSGLREYARNWLANNDADALIMGHSHVAECTEGPKGTYCNLGNWYESRTFARLDEDGIHLLQWNGTRAVDIEAAQGP
jgi:UDP-2,3-diacylglucosamine hydrolase